MAIRLKDQNTKRLAMVTALNLAFFAVVVKTGSVVADKIEVGWLANLLPAAGISVFVSILNAQFSPLNKARLVFWRWADPLPGAFAFTKIGPEDPRVDMGRLEQMHGTLPTTPREQNSLWYRHFKSVEVDPGVEHSHREFLFTRDYATISFMLLLSLGALAFGQVPSKEAATIYFLILLAQYLVVTNAARQNGVRLVGTVLALKSAEK